MNRCLICKILFAQLILSTSIAWGQSSISLGELNWPRFENIAQNLKFGFYYTNDFVSNTGGVKAGPRNIGALDLYLESDLRKYSNLPGEVMIHYNHINKNDQRGAIGDTNYASNIDMPDQVDRLTDVYYQHHWSDKFATLLGIQDISTEFNVSPVALNFLNSSFGTDTAFAMSGVNGPSIYPVTTVGFRSAYKFNDELTLLAGVYDGDPGDSTSWRKLTPKVSQSEGFMYISELALASEDRKMGIGGWSYSKAREKNQEDSGSASDYGAYSMYEQKIGVATFAFARYGWASPLVSSVQSNAVTGIVHRGIFQKIKAQDEAGIGYTRAHFSRSHRTANDLKAAHETAYELYYQFKPHKIVLLRPDLQYILNPSGNPSEISAKEAWAIGFRTVVEI